MIVISVIRNRHHDYLNIIRFVLSISKTFIVEFTHEVYLSAIGSLFLLLKKEREKTWSIYF